MFSATISIDLSQESHAPSRGLVRLIEWLFPHDDAKSGRRNSTVASLTVFEGLVDALVEAGFDDAVSVVVNERPLFVDEDEDEEDLLRALKQVVRSGALRAGFTKLELVASLRKSGLHSLVEVTFDEDVLRGEHELTIRWSSRLTFLRVKPGEGPLEYRQRVLDSTQSGVLRSEEARVVAAVARLASALDVLQPIRVEASGVRVRVVVPGPTQLGRLRHLGFRGAVRSRVYRPAPTTRSRGAYDDPHVHHYYDPYHDLLSWILVVEAREGRWDAQGVEFVRPDGVVVDVTDCAPEELGVPLTAVRFHRDRLEIDPTMPEVGFHPAEAGSPHAPGWGGDAG